MANMLSRLLSFVLAASVAFAQLSGSVGPTTPLSEKQGTICNVLDFGGEIGSTVSPCNFSAVKFSFNYRCSQLFGIC